MRRPAGLAGIGSGPEGVDRRREHPGGAGGGAPTPVGQASARAGAGDAASAPGRLAHSGGRTAGRRRPRRRKGTQAVAPAPVGGTAASGPRPGGAYWTRIEPCIAAQWPGKLQKNTYGPSPWMALTGKLTDVDPPPPISSVWAMTRSSPFFT